jgi:photosystem II stability/assembly factor-like uncharacterized protein
VSSQCACETSAPRFFTPRLAGLSVTGFTTNGGGRPFVRVLWTDDAGDSWRSSEPRVGRAVDVSFADARSVWITGQRKGNLPAPFNLLLRTDDAGAHWQTIRLPFDAGRYRLEALSATVAYGFRVAAAANVIVFTYDGGQTWHTIHAALNAG